MYTYPACGQVPFLQRNQALRYAGELGFEQGEFYGGLLPLDASREEIVATRKKTSDLAMSISVHGVNRLSQDADETERYLNSRSHWAFPRLPPLVTPNYFDHRAACRRSFIVRGDMRRCPGKGQTERQHDSPRHRFATVDGWFRSWLSVLSQKSGIT